MSKNCLLSLYKQWIIVVYIKFNKKIRNLDQNPKSQKINQNIQYFEHCTPGKYLNKTIQVYMWYI